ncbi:hypothetical protein BO86DRAFT_415550 [Aspergillus japonicus CBS 114.51]|uniref:L-tryptophan decarboxylase PsiD-like domain-containing protein n=1 Tax=Aspergillus japonicus CBS 114.51 TaxID=1448312 RepID=A0A8T8XCP2_ASPJA|nr:hypothetical protein BO86DRAFT_415550 [Aspergillus japonicus CBS 114.51]RAH86033.1 hypothetical protein BO86DRAFT_415550 [Aspergillus japonicus CBS 114.51]
MTKPQIDHAPTFVDRWSLRDQHDNSEWLVGVTHRTENSSQQLHPTVREFGDLIENRPHLRMLFALMSQDVPQGPRYLHDLSGRPQIRDYRHMLRAGIPLSALLNWPMGTQSGFAALLDPEVNAMIKKILGTWGENLQSPDSIHVLGSAPTDWFGPTGLADLTEVANIGHTNYAFDEILIANGTVPYRGFQPWDDFFIRSFREGIRPVAGNDSVIANACESKPYKVQHNASAHDQFWVKERPYSIVDMLGGNPLSEKFIGGTVYQAFLSSLNYHRWHAPVSGRIMKAFTLNGTYYSEPLIVDLAAQEQSHDYLDELNPIAAQPYLTSVATRAVIFIEADNPAIGTVAFIGVGMAEVSTCDITVKDGDHVHKGDELGMFHYGGSTHCLLFQKGVNVTRFPATGQAYNVPVRGHLATIG